MAVRLGEVMMKSGAEIYRVDASIEHICRAAGITHVETFATPTGIFVSIGSGGENGEVETYIKSIRERTIDLDKISQLNSLSRSFAAGETDVESGIRMISKIEKDPPYSIPVRLLGAGLCSCFFCLMFGGGFLDGLSALGIGGISFLLSIMMSKIKINFFVQDFMCCALAAVLAITSSSIGLSNHYDYIIIGSIMIFAPGAAITNSLRDFLSGDMLSGLARGAEAIAVAISIAAGVGMVIKIWHSIGGIL